MATRVHEVVHTLRQKPQHVRENIAIGIAAGVTVLVAAAWFAANALDGTFSLAPSSLAAVTDGTNTATVSDAVSSGKDNFTQLLGAAGAALGASSSPASIEIVDTQVHSTLDTQNPAADATVIHF